MNNFTTRLIKQLSVVFSFCMISFSGLYAQTFEWASQYSGNGNDFGTSVTADDNGNVYTTGYYFDEIDLDPGAGVDLHTTPTADQDVFVSKLDVNGDYVWGFTLSSVGRNRGNKVISDDSGNIYVTGYFENTVNFDPNGSFDVTSSSDRDIFIAKYDTDANLIWVRQFESPNYSEGVSIALDFTHENIYSTGLFGGTCNFDPGNTDTELTVEGGVDSYVAKLDVDGNFQWVKQIGGPNTDIGYDLVVDVDGNVYSTGFFETTCEFDFDGTSTTKTVEGGRDIYVVKHNPTGGFEWVKHFGGTLEGRGQGITVDESGGVYTTGFFIDEFNFDLDNTDNVHIGDGRDYYIVKQNSVDGTIDWMHPFGSPGQEWGYQVKTNNIGDVYVSGFYGGTIDFDPGVGVNSETADSRDGFIHILDSSGVFKEVLTFDDAGSTEAFGAFVDKSWNIYSTGFFNNDTQFDSQGGTALFTATAGGNDAFIVKFNGDCTAPDAPTLTETANDFCPNNTTIIDITAGNLNDGTDWVWYSDSMFTDSIFAGLSFTTPSLTDTTTYYVRGEGACEVNTSEITINVGDITPPVITTSPVTHYVDSGACYFRSEDLAVPTVTDDCALDTTYNDADLLLFDGVHTITWTAIDIYGNSSTETQDVTVIDDEDPSITAPGDVTVSADVNCEANGVALGTHTATDNCSVDTVFNDAPTTFPIGATLVTWTVVDASGNTNTDTQNVTVVDDTNPTIAALPADILVNNDPGVCEAVVNWAAPTANDNCPGATIAQTNGLASGSTFPVGVHTIEYTATDAAGNEFSDSFTVTVEDNENPTVTAPADITVSADNSCQANPGLGTPTTGDNCGIASVSNDAPASFPLGSTIVTWTITDVHGNVNTATQDVTVVDDIDPTIVGLPADINANVDPGTCSAVVNWIAPTVIDNCVAPSINQTGGLASGSLFPIGSTIIEYTATDGSGNTTIETFTVNVADDENPTITAPTNLTVSADNNCQATGVALGTPTTNDNCGVASVTNDAPSIFTLGLTTVTWTVTDDAGNITTDTQDVTVEDDEDPKIIAPADITVSADASCEATVANLGTPVTSDNCSILSVTNDAPATYPFGVTTVTWTIEDGSGNITTDTQDVIVEDDTNPVIVDLPADVAVSNDAGVCEAVVSWVEPTTTDNCTGATISQTGGVANGDPFPVGVNTVEYTAVDGSGNTTVETFTVTVTDDEDPTITAPTDVTVSADNNCQATGVALGASTTSDNCGVASVTNDAPTIYSIGVTTVTWTVTDDAGNISTDTQDVIVEDDTNPVIVDFPADVTVSNDAGICEAVVSWTEPTVTDNCTGATISQTGGVANGDPFPVGVNTVEYTALDGSGNTTVETFTVTVTDDEDPTITAPTDVTVSADNNCQATGVALSTPTTNDNCGVASVTNDAPTIFSLGVTTVTWTVTDDAGNITTDTQDVTVEDDEDPTIIAPADITVSADASCEATVANLGTAVTSDNCSIVSVTNDAPATYLLGVTTVTWTIEDGSGNISTDTQDVIVEDDTNPVIVDLPADIAVSNDAGVCEAVVSWVDPTVTDNCSGATITLTSAIPNGDPFPVGVNTVEYTATDGSGNEVVGTFTVTVTDDENPTIAAPADLNVPANNFCTAIGVVLGTAITGDNCAVSTVTNDGPAIYPLGTTIVTWTVTDDAGNMATATQNVTVTDSQDPTVIAPADIDLTADTDCEATVSDLGSPVSSDNCSVVSVTNDAPAVFPLGVTVVTWTATDGSGNTSTDTQEVTVVDEIDPTIVDLPADISVSNDAGVCEAVVSWVDPTVDDNCSGASITQTAGASSGSAFPVGVSTIEYTATDGSGNSVTASFTITVTDDENPTIVAASDTVIEANNFCVALNVVLDAPTVNDNCGVASVENDAPVIYDLGTTSVTWTVTDDSGNTATAVQLVTIADSTAPTITAPLPVTAYVDDTCQVSGVDLGMPTTSDNCAVDTVYNDAPSVYTTGNYTITWVAEDASGNISMATQDVTILDTILPTANLMDTTITLSPDGPITLLGSDIDLGSTDNCGLSEVVLMQEVYDCDDLGVNQIGVEVIDVHGNVLDTYITVTVVESGIDLDFDMIDDACDDDVNTTVVDVPSGFTPNGDGINDLFIIPGMSEYTSIELSIFDRYGNLVYENSQYENDWDGTSSKNGGELPDGTYFYVLELDGGERYNGYVQINRTLK